MKVYWKTHFKIGQQVNKIGRKTLKYFIKGINMRFSPSKAWHRGMQTLKVVSYNNMFLI